MLCRDPFRVHKLVLSLLKAGSAAFIPLTPHSPPLASRTGPKFLMICTAVQHIVRKERAVGIIPGAPTIYEVLEEMAITVQQQLLDQKLPFCAFNG